MTREEKFWTALLADEQQDPRAEALWDEIAAEAEALGHSDRTVKVFRDAAKKASKYRVHPTTGEQP